MTLPPPPILAGAPPPAADRTDATDGVPVVFGLIFVAERKKNMDQLDPARQMGPTHQTVTLRAGDRISAEIDLLQLPSEQYLSNAYVAPLRGTHAPSPRRA